MRNDEPSARSLVGRARAWTHDSYVRLAVLASFASVVAFALGSLSPHVSAVVAAITALITVRPTLHASVQEALRQVLGVVVGAGTAYIALKAIGAPAVSLLLALLAAFVAARMLRLGEEGAMAVGVTVILVVAPGFAADAVEARLLGVAVGSVCALVFSYFMRPGTPHGRALDAAVEQGRRVSALLTMIGQVLTDRRGAVPGPLAAMWLAEAQDILASTSAIRDDAEDAVAGARWSPIIRRDEAAAVLEQVRTTESTALTVVSMCRDLLMASDHEAAFPAEVAFSLSDVLFATADAVTEQSDVAQHAPAELLDDRTGPVRIARASRQEAASAVRNLDDTAPLLLGGSLLRDSQKITELLSSPTDPGDAREPGQAEP